MLERERDAGEIWKNNFIKPIIRFFYDLKLVLCASWVAPSGAGPRGPEYPLDNLVQLKKTDKLLEEKCWVTSQHFS